MHFADYFQYPATLNSSCSSRRDKRPGSPATGFSRWGEASGPRRRGGSYRSPHGQVFVRGVEVKTTSPTLDKGIFTPVLLKFEAFFGHFRPISEAFL